MDQTNPSGRRSKFQVPILRAGTQYWGLLDWESFDRWKLQKYDSVLPTMTDHLPNVCGQNSYSVKGQICIWSKTRWFVAFDPEQKLLLHPFLVIPLMKYMTWYKTSHLPTSTEARLSENLNLFRPLSVHFLLCTSVFLTARQARGVGASDAITSKNFTQN